MTTTRATGRALRLASLAAVAGVLAAACSASGGAATIPVAPLSTVPPAASSAMPASAGPASVAPGASSLVVAVAQDPKLGAHLTGQDGKSLYLLTKDGPGRTTCAGGCASAWPPFEIGSSEPVTAGSGVTGTLATITRADDGKRQVTYNGIPLYYFASDAKAGDVNGEGVGGVWFLVGPASSATSGRIAGGVGEPSPSSPAPSSSSGGGYGYTRGAVTSPTPTPARVAAASPRRTAAPTPVATRASAGSAAVRIVGFAFTPASLTVKVGTTVAWTNAADVSHTVTADDGAFNSGPIATGTRFTRTFTSTGTFAYHCSIHPSMTATITVTG